MKRPRWKAAAMISLPYSARAAEEGMSSARRNSKPYATVPRRPSASPRAACALSFGKSTVITDVVKMPIGRFITVIAFCSAETDPSSRPLAKRCATNWFSVKTDAEATNGSHRARVFRKDGSVNRNAGVTRYPSRRRDGSWTASCSTPPARTPTPIETGPRGARRKTRQRMIASEKTSGLRAETVKRPCEFSTAIASAPRLTGRM